MIVVNAINARLYRTLVYVLLASSRLSHVSARPVFALSHDCCSIFSPYSATSMDSHISQVYRNVSIVEVSLLAVFRSSQRFYICDGIALFRSSLGFGLGGFLSKYRQQLYSKRYRTSWQSASRKYGSGSCQKLCRSVLCDIWFECARNTLPSLDCASEWHCFASTQLFSHLW